MEPVVVVLVLTGAVMHAVWNTVVKIDHDRLITMAMVISTTGLLAPFLLLMGPAPSAASWPYILLSVLLNNAYFLFLIEAYRVGDLSHAYPLARGSAPLMVAGGAALFAGESLSAIELLGVCVISAGVMSLLMGSGFGIAGNWRRIAYPLLTGLMIAAYTVVDGIGVRLSGSPAGYIGWLFLLSPIPILGIAALRRGRRLLDLVKANWQGAVLGGCLNFGSYGLSIWALSLGAMASVSALRETSVIVAALIGTRFLGEPFGARRVAAAVTVVIGVVLINLA